MPDFQFIDSRGDLGEQSFMAWGAMRGPHISQPNNHLSIFCIRAEDVCHGDAFSQIGVDQVGRIEFTDYKITEWTPGFIQAVDQELCAKTTLNVSRNSYEVNFVREPIRISDPVCAGADMSIDKWSLGRPAYWEKLSPGDEMHKGRFAVR
jgi:hypothetical protein